MQFLIKNGHDGRASRLQMSFHCCTHLQADWKEKPLSVRQMISSVRPKLAIGMAGQGFQKPLQMPIYLVIRVTPVVTVLPCHDRNISAGIAHGNLSCHHHAMHMLLAWATNTDLQPIQHCNVLSVSLRLPLLWAGDYIGYQERRRYTRTRGERGKTLRQPAIYMNSHICCLCCRSYIGNWNRILSPSCSCTHDLLPWCITLPCANHLICKSRIYQMTALAFIQRHVNSVQYGYEECSTSLQHTGVPVENCFWETLQNETPDSTWTDIKQYLISMTFHMNNAIIMKTSAQL